jgi:hypothetical protein
MVPFDSGNELVRHMELRDVRRWLAEKFVWHWGEQLRMQRAAAARGFGLPGAEFASSEPANSVSLTTHQTTATSYGSRVWPWLAGLGIVLAFIAASILVAAFWGSGKPPVTTQQTAPPPSTAPAQSPAQSPATPPVDPIELEVQWWTDEAGKIHFGQPKPVSPAPAK